MTSADHLDLVKRALARMTPGPWRWWTSNSLRRLSSDPSGKDGDVAHAYRCRDGMVDIDIREEDMEGIVALRNQGPALVAELESLRAACAARDAMKIGDVFSSPRGKRYRVLRFDGAGPGDVVLWSESGKHEERAHSAMMTEDNGWRRHEGGAHADEGPEDGDDRMAADRLLALLAMAFRARDPSTGERAVLAILPIAIQHVPRNFRARMMREAWEVILPIVGSATEEGREA